MVSNSAGATQNCQTRRTGPRARNGLRDCLLSTDGVLPPPWGALQEEDDHHDMAYTTVCTLTPHLGLG